MEVFDVEFLKKRVGENEGICRVEPTIQDVRAVCLVLEIRLSKTGIESFGSISERKMKGKALELAFLKTSHHIPYIKQIHQKRICCLLSKATLKSSSERCLKMKKSIFKQECVFLFSVD